MIPGDGACADTYGICTLRAAIEEANALAGADVITFANSMTIQVSAAAGILPRITEQLRIDASSAWNNALNRPGVILDGGDQSFNGISIGRLGPDSQIYGLHIRNFHIGVLILSAHNTIGGLGPGQRNVIGGNASYGVYLEGSDAHDNLVQGNWIGLDASGEAAHPNGVGVSIYNTAHNNVIGGLAEGSGNVISGNTRGIYLAGDGPYNNEIYGNKIGTSASGYLIGNGYDGVYVQSGEDNRIGNFTYGEASGNLISDNAGVGVWLYLGHNTSVENNRIVVNGSGGISVKDSPDNMIGYNEIAGNTGNGVTVSGATAVRNSILGNSIYYNSGKGIRLINGGNAGLAPPVITSANLNGVSGTGCAGCAVQLFSDSADEGQFYDADALANASGRWSFSGSMPGPIVTALVTDSNGNTSEFSAPKSLVHKLYMPVARKK